MAVAGDWPTADLEHLLGCPVCGSPARARIYSGMHDRLFTSPGSWTLWRCGGCASAYLDPRPDLGSIGRAYARYMTHGQPARRPTTSGALASIKRLVLNGYLNSRYGYRLSPGSRVGAILVPLIPHLAGQIDRSIRHLHVDVPNPRVLDFGCANGEFLLRAQGLGWETEGIDFDAEALEHARAAGLSVRAGSLSDLDPDEMRFDAITLGHVIEHLHDPVAELRRAYDLLRPGGTIWLATPNVDALGHRFFKDAWFALDPPRHLVLFNERSLTTALEEAGFERIEALRPGPDARWLFPPSLAIARGLDPLGSDPAASAPQLGLKMRLRARAAEAVSWRRPRVAEELIVAARTPG